MRIPWKALSFGRVLFDYKGTDANTIPHMKNGELVVITNKDGDHRGWWKGEISERVSSTS